MKKTIKILGGVSVFALMLIVGLFMGVNYASADAQTSPLWNFTEPPISSSADLTNLALNSNDYPGVAYIENNNLYYRECMSGDCTVATNWSSATLVADTSYELNNPVLHFNVDDKPVIVFKHNDSGETHFARYLDVGADGSCGNTTYNGSTEWNCAYPYFHRYGSDYKIDFDIAPNPSSGNDVYYIVGRTNSGTHKVRFTYCEEASANYCDTSGNWTGYDLNTTGGVEVSKVAADGNYIHVVYFYNSVPDEIRHIACDKNTTNCDVAGDWTYVTDEKIADENGSSIYPIRLMDLEARNGRVGVLFSILNDTWMGNYSTPVQYLEYVGSGGNGSGSPWLGSAKWNGTQVYGNNPGGEWNGSLDYSSVYGVMIGLRNAANNTANLLTCSSNCEGSWDGDWTDTMVFDSDGGYSTIGNDSRVVAASNGYPRFSFNGSNFYGQEDDEPEPAQVPELPTNNLWKVLIAVLALGLVIGVAAFMKKKK